MELVQLHTLAPIPDAPGYLVSAWGNVYCTFRRRNLKADTNRGYRRFKLAINGTLKNFRGGPLVLRSFVSPRPPRMECCHGNGNRSDDRLWNLRWGSHMENALDTIRHGRTTAGERSGRAKLTSDDVAKIRAMRRDGLNNKQIAARFGVTHSNVSAICLRKSWRTELTGPTEL